MARIINLIHKLSGQVLRNPKTLSIVVNEILASPDDAVKQRASIHLIRRLIELNLLQSAERLTRTLPLRPYMQASEFATISEKYWEAGNKPYSLDLLHKAVSLARTIDDDFVRAFTLNDLFRYLQVTQQNNVATDILMEAGLAAKTCQDRNRGDTEKEQVHAHNCTSQLRYAMVRLAEAGEWDKAYQLAKLSLKKRETLLQTLEQMRSRKV